MERAYARAIHYGDPSYVRVNKILEAGLDREEIDSHPSRVSLPVYEHARSVEEFFGELAVEANRC